MWDELRKIVITREAFSEVLHFIAWKKKVIRTKLKVVDENQVVYQLKKSDKSHPNLDFFFEILKRHSSKI